VFEDNVLLGYEAASLDHHSPCFERSSCLNFQGFGAQEEKKIKILSSSETSGNDYQKKQRHIPENKILK
jgi:hypothetical protein